MGKASIDMEPSNLGEVLPIEPPTQRLASLARLLRGLSGLTQIGLMAALLVMWKQYHVPFATAFERCFVAGVIVYVTLGTAASILISLARLQPFHLLLRHLLAAVSIVIFGALHYLYGLGIFHAALAWAGIYLAARVLVGRIERRALARFGSGQ